MIRSTFSARSSARRAAWAFCDNLFGGGHDPSAPQRGDDLRYDLEITLEEAALAAKRKFPSPRRTSATPATGSGMEHGSRMRACGTCGGRGQVLMSRGIFQHRANVSAMPGARDTFWKGPANRATARASASAAPKITLRIPRGVDGGSRLRFVRHR